MYYSLDNWLWDPNGFPACWTAPDGTVAAVDLATLPQMSVKPKLLPLLGQSTRPGGFFCSPKPLLTPSHVALGEGDCRTLKATSAAQDAWKTFFGYRPQGDCVVDLLWDHLTTGADPTGQAGPKPLLPDVSGVLRLDLGGHSTVRAEPFVWGRHAHTNRVQALVRDDFRAHFLRDPVLARKWLGAALRKYRVDDWKLLVPTDLHAHVEGPLAPATTVSDNFNRIVATGLGTASGGGTYTHTVGANTAWNCNNTNALMVTLGLTDEAARLDSDLSSADMDGYVTVVSQTGSGITTQAGPIVRHDSSAATFYMTVLRKDANTQRTFKCSSGAFTQMSAVSVTVTDGDKAELKINSTTWTAYQNDVQTDTNTDTAVSGFTRSGLYGIQGNGALPVIHLDNFSCSDLVAAPDTTFPAYYQPPWVFEEETEEILYG